ncbi:uncharacterized protein LOC131240147 [Magnolia sinica]|uniref:uncharacterized protein LOC131240147 n=1 Tax=Magnolia sinica TaxID=86752 RepID=UPI00265A6434|nr:uncharacterized protein LOC131240147 [Magnolia sinica]
MPLLTDQRFIIYRAGMHLCTAMAATVSLVAPTAKTQSTYLHSPKPIQTSLSSLQKARFLSASRRASSASASPSSSPSPSSPIVKPKQEEGKRDQEDEVSMSIDALTRFINVNLGNWNGSFFQYDSNGNLMQKVSTKLAGSSYGENELISLIQTLYIKQPASGTSISGSDPEPEWMEYKIKETNMFTADKHQQLGFFPKEKAFSLRYQTAGMLEAVLRAGILGEDDIGEKSPKNLKLPSRRPSVVCENCLYSQEKDMRARAFHIMDPKGILEMLLIFLEQRGDGVPLTNSLDFSKDSTNRITPLLGQWKGHSVTKRSGVYGATIAQADTVALLEMDDKGQLIQDITSTSARGGTTNVHWTGTVSNNLVVFDGGFQMTLLPGGMYMGCPCDVGKSVAQSQSFLLEFCWMESPGKRQRLVRTYDVEGLAVSSTYIHEVKV